MNNHAPRVPGAAPAGPALSHGITEEERGAMRKRARMCHTRAQSLPSRLHRLWSVSRVAGTSFGPPVSVSLFLSSFLPPCLTPSASSLSFTALSHSDERRINASLSLFSLSNHRRSVRVHSRLLLSQLHRCTSIRDPADFRLHFSGICVHNVSLGSPHLKSTFDGATKPLAHTPSEPSSSPLLLPSC